MILNNTKENTNTNINKKPRFNIRPRLNKPNFRTGITPKLKIIPIGGLEFIGSNCTAIQYGKDIIVIDAGMGFPFADQYGVDYLIPNPKFLEQNKANIKGLIITHGHMDHIGGIPYLMEPMGFPTVYATAFSKELITNRLSTDFAEVNNKTNIQLINKDSVLRLGEFNISFFGVNHSIPESMGVVIRTKAGIVVHTGDFKFDNSPVNEPQAEYGKIAKLGSEGVLCLLSDSTNSFKKGHSMSESEIVTILDDLIANIKGRVIIGTFSSMVNRLIELLKIAHKYGRKVYISGRSMELAIKTAQKIGYVNIPEGLIIQGYELKKYRDDQIMVLATGAQGEEMSALSRISKGEHKYVNVKKGDNFILSASVIPGNDLLVQILIDELSKKGADVYHSEIMNLHTTGHGHQDDQMLMINLVKPKFFMPVHGFQSFLFQHGKTAQKLGIPEKNVIIAHDGSVIEVDSRGWKEVNRFEAKPIMVSGLGVGDVGATVLEDRRQLASYGVLIYTLLISSKDRSLLRAPHINSRGFVYMKQSKDLIMQTSDLIKSIYEAEVKKGSELDSIKEKITNHVEKFLFEATEREPMVLATVMIA